jgi:hypothetical protein
MINSSSAAEKVQNRAPCFSWGLPLSTVGKLLSLVAIVLAFAGACAPLQPPLPGRLQLSNPHFPLINVEAVITANPDCEARDAGYVSTLEFTMPNNATKFIEAPPGTDICWRSDRNPGRPAPGRWSRWDRAYLVPGRLVDATL